MHTLLAAFFAMLFSASHSAARPVAQDAIAARPYTYAITATTRTTVPRLRRASYPERACASCRRTSITYRAR